MANDRESADVGNGRGWMFARSRNLAHHHEGIGATPSGLPPKRNPDRAIGVDFRFISDLRRAEIGFEKGELYPTLIPTVYDLVVEIICLGRKNPEWKPRRAQGIFSVRSPVCYYARAGEAHRYRICF